MRREQYLRGIPNAGRDLPDIGWFSAMGTAVDWTGADGTLTCILTPPAPKSPRDPRGRDILVMFNPTPESREFLFPTVARAQKWRKFIDTAAPAPADVYPEFDGPLANTAERVVVPYKSLQVFVSTPKLGM